MLWAICCCKPSINLLSQKMLVKSWWNRDLWSILRADFMPIFLRQTVIREKLCKALSYEKAHIKCWWNRDLYEWKAACALDMCDVAIDVDTTLNLHLFQHRVAQDVEADRTGPTTETKEKHNLMKNYFSF